MSGNTALVDSLNYCLFHYPDGCFMVKNLILVIATTAALGVFLVLISEYYRNRKEGRDFDERK